MNKRIPQNQNYQSELDHWFSRPEPAHVPSLEPDTTLPGKIRILANQKAEKNSAGDGRPVRIAWQSGLVAAGLIMGVGLGLLNSQTQSVADDFSYLSMLTMESSTVTTDAVLESLNGED